MNVLQRLETLEENTSEIEIIQEDGEATTENVYSSVAVNELLKAKKDKKQEITTGVEFETRSSYRWQERIWKDFKYRYNTISNK